MGAEHDHVAVQIGSELDDFDSGFADGNVRDDPVVHRQAALACGRDPLGYVFLEMSRSPFKLGTVLPALLR
jgi:hypothetical protein